MKPQGTRDFVAAAPSFSPLASSERFSERWTLDSVLGGGRENRQDTGKPQAKGGGFNEESEGLPGGKCVGAEGKASRG